MAANEKRTLQITAALQDFVSKNLNTISRGITKFAVLAKDAFGKIWQKLNPVTLGITGLAAAWAAFKGGQSVVEVLDSVDALDKLGDSLGTNVDRMAVLKGAIEIGGGSAEDFEATMRSLGKAVNGVVDKDTAKMVEAFERIGIGVEDLRKLDAVDLFDKISLGLERYSTAQERAGALARIMPSQFQAMFATLGNGQEQFRGLVALAQMFVGTISENGAKAAGRFADAVQLIGTAAKSVGRDALIRIAEQFAPALEKVAVFIAENRDAIAAGLAAIIAGIIKVVTLVGVAVLKILAWITGSLDELFEKFGEIPIIGGAIQSALESVFDVKPLSENARKIRDEAKAVAKELTVVEKRISQIRLLPAEMDPSGARFKAFEEEVTVLRNKLADLANKFAEEAPGQPDLATTAMQTSALQQMSEMLTKLSNFEDLPGLPTDLSAIIRKIFGKGGPEAAESSVEQFFDGVSDQLEKVRDKWKDFGAAGRNAVNQLVDGGLDSLADTFADIITRTKSAKEAFRDYARSLLSDLARIISRLAIMNAVSTIFQSSAGGGGGAGGAAAGAAAGAAIGTGAGAQSLGPSHALGLGSTPRKKRLQLGSSGGIPMSATSASSAASQSVGGDTHVHFHINAIDAKSVQQLLLEQGSTIAAVVAERAGSRTKFRQDLTKATR